ncbi:chemotaxis protein CheA [Nitrosomonas sp. ANs5]|uniref:chemotaxis protein CheA n=1 Tax=Nitrosomonas sp. ANs5 TaxID=3423941 RepID=UPI003D33CD9F
MSTDLEQFYQIFFEEASELLAEMESRLLGLDIQSPDAEDLNAIFRVAHSIKGGAGTFGFTDMTEMTHMLESLLDKLRKGELEIRSEMVDAFLQAGDVLKKQLDGHRGLDKADAEEAAAVAQKLKALMVETAQEQGVSAPVVPEQETGAALAADGESAGHSPAQPQATQLAASEDKSTQPAVTYHIEFACGDLAERVKQKLLHDLACQGVLENLTAPDSGDRCVLRLTTQMSEEDTWEALVFIVDPVSLSIRQEAAASAVQSPDPGSESEQNDASLTGRTDETDQEVALQGSPAPFDENAQNLSGAGNDESLAVDAAVARDDQSAADASASGQSSKKPAEPTKAANNESSSIRVSIEKVDQMINLVGELVITQAMLAQTASQIDPVIYEKLINGLNQLERNTRDLQEAVMSIRMMPISFVFSRFPRVVRDVASKLNKQVDLKTVGEGTELDKGLIEKITDPLTHLIRNSLDHGIEAPDKREAMGKPAKGTITLRASHQGGSIVIEVADDGAGLNREKILAKARSRGLAVSDNMPDQDVWMLIFEAGFSTADAITDVSGRGVGMDVVKRNIQGLGGRVEIDSVAGQGTRISIRLPLTLAILDGLSVAVGDQLFIVPLTYITESLKPAAADIKTVRGQGRVVQVRGEYLPVIALHEVFHLQPAVQEIHEGILVILDAEGSKAAMFVDTLVGQHQVVIKSLESNYRRVQGVSGATIMGDGSVALILDAVGLVHVTKQRMVDAA